MTRKIGILLLLLLAPVRARPQAEEPEAARRPARAREELFKMVDAYVVSNLQESLALSDEQFVKLLPLVRKLQADRRSFAQRRFETLGEVRRALAAEGAPGEARVAELLKRIKAGEAEEPLVLRKDLDGIDAVLSPLQQAKFRVLEVEVERRMRDLMSQVQRRGPPGGRSPRRQPEG